MALAPNPQLGSGLGGANATATGLMGGQTIAAPATDDPNFQVSAQPGFSIPQGYGLPSQINFPEPPSGVYTDPTYYAADADLRASTGDSYAKILQQLGYQDPVTGGVVPGTTVQDANIQLAQYQEAMQQAQIKNVNDMQNAGTLFSGYRPVSLAQAQSPIQDQIANLHLTTARNLGDLYNQAQELVTQYGTGQMKNLADAAQRQLDAIRNQQLLAALSGYGSSGGGGGAGGGGGGGGGGPELDQSPTQMAEAAGINPSSQVISPITMGTPHGPVKTALDVADINAVSPQYRNLPTQALPFPSSPAAPAAPHLGAIPTSGTPGMHYVGGRWIG
jgi:hypothetical protein